MDKLLNALGMCKRAGALASGYDAALEAVRKGAPLVVLSNDASERTVRNILAACKNTKAVRLPRNRNEIEAVLGRALTVAAVNDKNLAALVTNNLGSNTEVEYAN